MVSSRPFDPLDEAYRQWNDRWPEAALSMATATAVMRAQQIILQSVDTALRPFNLTFARYEALALLSFSRAGELPMGKIGHRLMIHPTSVTSIIDRLVRDHLVERRRHETDRRTTLAHITDLGRELVQQATDVLNAQGFGVRAMSDTEMKDLIALVRTLRAHAGDPVS